MRLRSWIARLSPAVVFLVLLALPAWARIGGGEHYNSGNHSSSSGGDGDGGFIIELLAWLVFNHPCIGIPVVIVVVIGYFYYQRQQGDSSTRKAIDQSETARRTTVNATAVTSWVNQLKAKDPAFELLPFFDRTKRLFVELQEAWFNRNLEPVRRHLSDATYQRLVTQLRLMQLQGVRDAIAEPKVLDLQIVGLEQTEAFDTVHVRVRASLRDEDAPWAATDEQARAKAMKKAPEAFTEVWAFVRKPGAQTKPGDDGFQGKCPNCGAPFAGGAANRCEFCGAIVNSGHYDWVVAEITQGMEFSDSTAPAGLGRVRQRDPAISTELLEDRASLAFWQWVEAQALGDPGRLAKLSSQGFLQGVQVDLGALKSKRQRRFFLECAVGSVDTLDLFDEGELDLAAIEIRWSAAIAVVGEGQQPPRVPTQPQRSVLVLQRKAGALTNPGNGMATNRCPQCNAPLSDNGQPSCEFCGTALAGGDKDWVVRSFETWEAWRAWTRKAPGTQRPGPTPRGKPTGAGARVPDREERERLVYLMAAMAMADGVVDQRERQLLKMASDRWGVPWANVELALQAGPGLFEKLMQRGSVEAEEFLRQLVEMALIDGKIDAKERKLLESAAAHLGLEPRLKEFLERR